MAFKITIPENKEKNFPTLNPGNYIGYVTGINKGMTKNTNKVFISLKLNIDGETHFSRRYFPEGNAIWFFVEDLKKLGYTLKPGEVDLEDVEKTLMGTKAEFTVTSREFDGKTYTDVNPVKAIGKATDEELIALSDGAPF